MRPGDVITCTACGATATAAWSSRERAWQEGWPLSLTWTHRGGFARVEVSSEAPELCIWCFERVQAVGAPWPRLTPDELARQIAYASAAPAHTPAPSPAAPGGQLSLL